MGDKKMEAGQLLKDARDAHKVYQGLKPRMERQGGTVVKVEGDPALAGAWLSKALALFAEARQLDPSALTELDDKLVNFMVEQLSRA